MAVLAGAVEQTMGGGVGCLRDMKGVIKDIMRQLRISMRQSGLTVAQLRLTITLLIHHLESVGIFMRQMIIHHEAVEMVN